MKYRFTTLVHLFTFVAMFTNCNAQTLSESFRCDSIDLFYSDLKFKFLKTDTVSGYEIAIYHKKGNLCHMNLVFVMTDTIDSNQSLINWLKKNSTNTNIIEYSNCNFLFDCNRTTPDTFYYCQNKSLYKELNFNKAFFENKFFYKNSKNEFYNIYRTKVIVGIFSSDDVKYCKYYYPFFKDYSELNSIYKYHYKLVLERHNISNDISFGCKVEKKENFECISIYD